MTAISKAMLITGCSTGIGRETAKLLAGNGWNVSATARRPASIADLEPWGCELLLDAAFDAFVRTQFPSPEPVAKA